MFLSLGPDWFLLLLQGHLHASTTVLALKLLLHFLSNPSLRGRFKDGLPVGSWVERSSEGMDIVMGEHMAVSSSKRTTSSWSVSGDQASPSPAGTCAAPCTLISHGPLAFSCRIPSQPHHSSVSGGCLLSFL